MGRVRFASIFEHRPSQPTVVCHFGGAIVRRGAQHPTKRGPYGLVEGASTCLPQPRSEALVHNSNIRAK